MREHIQADEGLYLTDTSIAARLGVGVRRWKAIAKALESDGFPKPNPLFGRRYWPTVRKFFDELENVGTGAPPVVDPLSREDWG